MTLNLNLAESCPPAPPPAAPHRVRAKYRGQADAGHLFGPFATRQRAEDCAVVLSGRPEVESAAVEPVPA